MYVLVTVFSENTFLAAHALSAAKVVGASAVMSKETVKSCGSSLHIAVDGNRHGRETCYANIVLHRKLCSSVVGLC